ncbi:MAG: hypothetical protein R2752_01615 [Vicinamibacterales bacterium]
MDPWPIPQPVNWVELLKLEETGSELERIRGAVARSAPFGSETWQAEAAERLEMTAALSRRGRPRRS